LKTVLDISQGSMKKSVISPYRKCSPMGTFARKKARRDSRAKHGSEFYKALLAESAALLEQNRERSGARLIRLAIKEGRPLAALKEMSRVAGAMLKEHNLWVRKSKRLRASQLRLGSKAAPRAVDVLGMMAAVQDHLTEIADLYLFLFLSAQVSDDFLERRQLFLSAASNLRDRLSGVVLLTAIRAYESDSARGSGLTDRNLDHAIASQARQLETLIKRIGLFLRHESKSPPSFVRLATSKVGDRGPTVTSNCAVGPKLKKVLDKSRPRRPRFRRKVN